MSLLINKGGMTRSPRTALPENSIWSRTSERSFRQRLVEVEQRTKAILVDPKVYDASSWRPVQEDAHTADRVLPLQVEQQIADDFAYLAAVREGAQSVAAVCVEEHYLPNRCLKLCFAAVDTLDDTICDGLRSIANKVQVSRNTHEPNLASAELAKVVTDLHHERLLGRLRSTRWNKPPHLVRSHKKALWLDFPNVIHRVQFVYPSKTHRALRRDVEHQLEQLARIYETLEKLPPGSDDVQQRMFDIVSASYTLCMHPSVRKFSQDLEQLRQTAQITAALKCLHQVEKIGAYMRIARSLVNTAQTYPGLFARIDLRFLEPYSSVPTEIAYEPWAQTCHVHAEIQLVAEYDVRQVDCTDQNQSQPRVIGASKYLCVLCFLFIKHQGKYFPANTHGRIYDQWTIPDLSEYSDEVRGRHRNYIDLISESLEIMSPESFVRRVEPMTSRQNLLSGVWESATT